MRLSPLFPPSARSRAAWLPRLGRRRASSKLSVAALNQNVVRAEYAVRGELIARASELKKQLAREPTSLAFQKLVECNIGNPQALKQQPISFNRQVLALLAHPTMLEWPEVVARFPPDVIRRAKEYLDAIPQGIGAYSESQGFAIVRQQVADFISARDGVPADPKDIFLTDGASKGVQTILKAVLSSAKDGVLVPIPQYPLYSASLVLDGAQMIGYYLSETNGWNMPIEELETSLLSATKRGVEMKALVVINPGNPTGNSLPLENMRAIIEFCGKHNLVLMADEVYQENVYDESRPFYSFKKVLSEMSPRPPVQLVSYHSTSKGFLGECGLRGGYYELVGFDPDVQAQLLKLASISLCSNTTGQIMTGLMVQPPKPGDASYDSYVSERDGILNSLKRRSAKLVTALNKLEGVHCNKAEGAMYVFPQISLPDKAVAAAQQAGKAADVFYALALLENTGIVVVPGSGFGQREGTYHFRTTFLPPEDDMDAVIERMSKFHTEFLAKYA